jgi:hypothetical protein
MLVFVRDRVTTEATVKAFEPTVLKVEGLRPGSRYRIEFEVKQHTIVWVIYVRSSSWHIVHPGYYEER